MYRQCVCCGIRLRLSVGANEAVVAVRCFRENRRVGQVCMNVMKPACLFRFLADRTNGRAYVTVFRPSVCLSVQNVLWLNGVS